MQSKKTLLVAAMTALMSLNNAYAAHDDAPKYEIKSADGKYGLGIGGLLQTSLDITHDYDSGDTTLDADLNKARLRLYGNAFDPRISYLIQISFDYSAATKKLAGRPTGSAKLSDFSINGVVNDHLQIATGKFAIPFARQQVMPAYKGQFFVPSILDIDYAVNGDANRDVGFLFHNGYHQHIEYAAALVKGGLGARAAYNHGDIDAYDPVDWNGGHLRWAAGVSGYLGWDIDKKTIEDQNKLLSVDGIVKYQHFTSNAVFYYNNKGNAMGAGVDAGYLMHHKWEPAIHYALSHAKATKQQVTAALTRYFYGHNVKAQLYGGLNAEDKAMKNFLFGLGLSFAI
jgi:hypothetical protein